MSKHTFFSISYLFEIDKELSEVEMKEIHEELLMESEVVAGDLELIICNNCDVSISIGAFNCSRHNMHPAPQMIQ